MNTEILQKKFVTSNQKKFATAETNVIVFSTDEVLLSRATHTAPASNEDFNSHLIYSENVYALTNIDWNVLILDESIGIDSVSAIITIARKLSGRKQIILISTLVPNRHEKLIALDVDDYIVRPYEAEEINFRISLAQSRSNNLKQVGYSSLKYDNRPDTRKNKLIESQITASSDNIYIAGEITMHLIEKKCFIRSVQIRLTKTEFDLLIYLIKSQCWTCSNHELLEKVLGYKNNEYLPALYSHMQRLRRKIASTGIINTRIKTIWKHGYQLEVLNNTQPIAISGGEFA